MNATQVDKSLLNQILKVADLLPNAFARSQFVKASRDLCKRMPADHLPVHLFQAVEDLFRQDYKTVCKVNEAIAKLFQNDRAQAA